MGSARTRELWFAVHQWIGLASLVFLVIAGATGSAIAFRPQIDAWLNPGLFRAPSASATLLTPGALAQRVEAQRPQARVALLPLSARAGRAVAVSVEPRAAGAALPYDQVFLDPSDARIIGQRRTEPGWDAAHLMQGVYELHVRLLAGTAGRWLMGIVAGLWALSSGVGLYLTLPRSGPFWRKWKPLWTVNPKSKLPRLLLDLHRASGLWLFLASLAVALSGCALSFYSEAVEPAVVSLSPSRVAALNSDAPPPGPKPRRLGWDAALARAETAAAQRAGQTLKPAVASFEAEANLYRIGFTRSGVRDYTGLGPVYWYVDAASGRVAYADDPYRDSPGRAFLRSLYPVHSGQALGVTGRILAVLLGLTVVEMTLTGGYLWWRKRGARKQRARPAAASV
jgi:uncharacterized iron-regulated membrane protein